MTASSRAELLVALKAKAHKYLEKGALRSAWSAARDEIVAYPALHDLLDAVNNAAADLVKADNKAGFTTWLDGLA